MSSEIRTAAPCPGMLTSCRRLHTYWHYEWWECLRKVSQCASWRRL